MRIPFVEKILKDDLGRSGGTLPPWIDDFLYVLNNFIDQIGTAVQNNLTFKDNFYGAEASYVLKSGASTLTQTYTPPAGKRIRGFQVMDAGGLVVTGTGFVRNTKDNGIAMTVNVQAAPSVDTTVVIQVFFM